MKANMPTVIVRMLIDALSAEGTLLNTVLTISANVVEQI
jgi:hypothetical protein